jgi:hypothetical protein
LIAENFLIVTQGFADINLEAECPCPKKPFEERDEFYNNPRYRIKVSTTAHDPNATLMATRMLSKGTTPPLRSEPTWP